MGEVFAERSGVINMGIEGIMLFGALCGVSVCYYPAAPLWPFWPLSLSARFWVWRSPYLTVSPPHEPGGHGSDGQYVGHRRDEPDIRSG